MVKLTLWIDDKSEADVMALHQRIALGANISVTYEAGSSVVTTQRIHVIETEIESDVDVQSNAVQ
jgi:hypothetical protein